jgi:phosphatidate cytidylyltransferase
MILLWTSAFAGLAALAVLGMERLAGRREAEVWTKFGVQLVLVAACLVPAWLGGRWMDVACVAVLVLAARELLGLRRQTPVDARGRAPELLVAFVLVVLGVLSLREIAARSFAGYFFFYAVIELNDSFANIVGRHVGKHKLAPAISPGKTWEGLLAGLAAASGSAWLLHDFIGAEPIRAAVLGGMLGVCGVVGDLAASVLKRRFGAKDFSRLLPAHGGVLDAYDSTLLVAPVFLWLASALA